MTTDSQELFERTERLSQLRNKYGHGIVDELLRRHGGIAKADLPRLDGDIAELLLWEPPALPAINGEVRIERVQEAQLVSAHQPLALGRLSDALLQLQSVHNEDRSISALLAYGARLYPVFLSKADRCCRC